MYKMNLDFYLNFLFILIFIQATNSVSNWPSKPDTQSKVLEDDELDGLITLYIYHSLESSKSSPFYFQRGLINIHPSRNEGIYIEERSLTVEEVEKLKELAISDDIYRVKLSTKSEDSSGSSLFSFTKACAIYESSLADTVTVTLDQNGLPIGIGISAFSPNCDGSSVDSVKLTSFNTTVSIVSLVNAPAPDTLTYIQRLEHEKAEKARGEQGDSRSFFAKYWMYIVPFVIFLFISGASGPEGQAAGR